MRFKRKKGADTPTNERVEGQSEGQELPDGGAPDEVTQPADEWTQPAAGVQRRSIKDLATGTDDEPTSGAEATDSATSGAPGADAEETAGLASTDAGEARDAEPTTVLPGAEGGQGSEDGADGAESHAGAETDAESTTVLAGTDADTDADADAAAGADDARGAADASAAGPDPDTMDETDARSAEAAGEADHTDELAAGAVTAKKKRKNKRGKKVLIGTGIVVVVLAAAYAGAAWFLGDRVPADTTVAGVDISGLAIEDAEQVLETELGGLQTSPLPLSFEGVTAEIEPGESGLSFDAEATVAQFTGFALHPQVLIGHVFGLGSQPAVSSVDEDELAEVLETLGDDLNISPVEGSIALAGAEAEITEPENGAAVDVEGSVEAIGQDWLSGERPIVLPSEVVEPAMGPDEIRTAMDEIVDPLLSGPVIVDINDTEVELSAEEVASTATLEVDGSQMVLSLDGQELAELVTEKEDSVGEAPRDARIELSDGEPTIVPAVTGTGLDPEALGEAVEEGAVATDEDDRVASIELSQTEADFTTEDAEALGVVEVIGSYSTPMPYDPPRTENLVIGTSRINGMLIMPGEEFSLLGALSPITTANGYHSSGVVVDGFLTEAAGGGLSQLSTTTFNAGFEAGMEDVTHQPHSRWFSRYPEGREATLYEPDLDMIWRNNTDYGVLIQAWVADDQTHVTLWGTDVWDVNITTGNRYNITQPQTLYNEGPRCEPESGGQSGFSVDVTRTVSAGGEVHEQRSYTHTYRPWNRVVCGAPPSSSSSDDDDD